MKKLLLGCLLITSLSGFASEVNLQIISQSGITATGHDTYEATKNNYFCRESHRDEGGRRVTLPKKSYESFPQENDLVIIPSSVDSFCNYESLDKKEISFEIPNTAKSTSTLRVKKVENPNRNIISCRTIMYGPRGRKEGHLLCSGLNVVEIDMDGNGIVEVDLE